MDRPVSDVEKLEALGRILAARGRRPTDRCAQLLSYVVSEDVEGRASQIKAVTIAQDVFGKGAEFDSSRDSSVRVEAKRLRDFLDDYYAGEGAADPLRIDIPKGAYAPCFIPQAAAPPSPATVSMTPGRGPAGKIAFLALTAIMALGAAGGLAMMVAGLAGAGRTFAPFGPTGLLVQIDAKAAPHDTFAIASDVLTRSPDLDVVSRTPWPWTPHYLLRLAQPVGDGVLTATLLHEPDNSVLAMRQFRPEEISSGWPADSLSEFKIWLAAIASRNGHLASDYFSRGAVTPEFHCIRLMEVYFVDQTDRNHMDARTCFEAELAAGHDTAPVYTGLAMLAREEFTDGRNPRPGNALDRALLLAGKAVALEPLNAHAQYALMTVLFAAGNVADAIRVGEEAVRLDPYDGEIVGGFAARLNTAGHHEEALPLLLRSERLRPGTAPWRNYGYFLAHLGLGEPERAADAALALRGRTNPLYLAALAIAYDIKDKPGEAQTAYQSLIAAEPDPVAMYQRRHYAPQLVERLSDALARVAARIGASAAGGEAAR